MAELDEMSKAIGGLQAEMRMVHVALETHAKDVKNDRKTMYRKLDALAKKADVDALNTRVDILETAKERVVGGWFGTTALVAIVLTVWEVIKNSLWYEK